MSLSVIRYLVQRLSSVIGAFPVVEHLHRVNELFSAEDWTWGARDGAHVFAPRDRAERELLQGFASARGGWMVVLAADDEVLTRGLRVLPPPLEKAAVSRLSPSPAEVFADLDRRHLA